MPMINLLPWREELRQKRKKEFGLALVGALLLATGVTLGTQLFYAQKISNQNQRIDILNNEIAELNEKIAEIEQLEAQKRRLIARMEVIEQLEATTPEAVTLIDALVETIPSGTYLQEATQENAEITVSGMAQSNARVSEFMRNVDDSEWIRNPVLLDIKNEGNGPIADGEFNLVITQVRINDDEEAQE
jgi:type IV pilus assembly protein PilN